jgi:hypothetical protein
MCDNNTEADDAAAEQQTIEAHFYAHTAIPGLATTRYNEDIRRVFGLASSGDRITVWYKLPGSTKTSVISGDVKKWSDKELRINDDTNFHVNLLSPDHDKFAYSFETQHGGETIGGCEVKSVELTTSVREYPFDIGDDVFVDWSEGMGPEENISGVVEGIGTGEDSIVSVTDYDTDEFGDAGKTFDCAPEWVSLPNESDSDETDGDSFGGFEFDHSDHNDHSDENETDDSKSGESGESEESELAADGEGSHNDHSDESDSDLETAGGKAIREHIDIDELMDELEGRSGFRKTKPDASGLIQYVWRMARFHGGYDTCMPVTASFWLQDYLDAEGIDASVSGVMDDAGKEITSELDKVAEAILIGFEENPDRAAQRWQKAGAI